MAQGHSRRQVLRYGVSAAGVGALAALLRKHGAADLATLRDPFGSPHPARRRGRPRSRPPFPRSRSGW